MLQAPASLSSGDRSSMVADLAALTPGPARLASLLVTLGYRPEPFGDGLYAPALPDPNQARAPVLLFPLHSGAGLAVRTGALTGRDAIRGGTIAAGLAALRTSRRRPGLLFLSQPQAPPPRVQPEQVVSLEGGVVPRIWPRCFGRFDTLVRVSGQAAHPGQANTAVNAIEMAVPILQALLQLKTETQARTLRPGHFADSPLQPRLTLSAAHGGSAIAAMPTMFDILLSRRYDPAENADEAYEEIKAVVAAATSVRLHVDLSITHHDTPVPDPDEPNRSREDRALAAGWGWPQVRFSPSSALMPGAIVLGGLERPDQDASSNAAFTTLDAMGALARTIHALLAEG